jgi:hypothetical protein
VWVVEAREIPARTILLGVRPPRGSSELTGDCAGARFAQVEDVVVERARGAAEELGNRGEGAVRLGQQVAGGADDFLGGDAGAPAGPAAGGGRTLIGADDDELAAELRQGGEDREEESAAGDGGVQVLVKRRAADPAVAQFGDHADERFGDEEAGFEGRGRCYVISPASVTIRTRVSTSSSAVVCHLSVSR